MVVEIAILVSLPAFLAYATRGYVRNIQVRFHQYGLYLIELHPIVVRSVEVYGANVEPVVAFRRGDTVLFRVEVFKPFGYGEVTSFLLDITIVAPDGRGLYFTMLNRRLYAGQVGTYFTGFKLPGDALLGRYRVLVTPIDEVSSKPLAPSYEAAFTVKA